MHLVLEPRKPVLNTNWLPKLDFGEPNVNVQKGFMKLGTKDGGPGTFQGLFPCGSDRNCTINIDGYTHTRGRFSRITNDWSHLSNLLRSSFLRNKPGNIRVKITGLEPRTRYFHKGIYGYFYKGIYGDFYKGIYGKIFGQVGVIINGIE